MKEILEKFEKVLKEILENINPAPMQFFEWMVENDRNFVSAAPLLKNRSEHPNQNHRIVSFGSIAAKRGGSAPWRIWIHPKRNLIYFPNWNVDCFLRVFKTVVAKLWGSITFSPKQLHFRNLKLITECHQIRIKSKKINFFEISLKTLNTHRGWGHKCT